MKTEETIDAILKGAPNVSPQGAPNVSPQGASNVSPQGATGVSPLGTHAFLDEFALAYHRAVAVRLRSEPETVLEGARRNLKRWTQGDAFGAGEQATLEEWREILYEADVERLIEIMTDVSEEGQRLRSSSPFVGALSSEERLEILAACEQRATV